MNRSVLARLFGLVAVLALVAAACGDSSDDGGGEGAAGDPAACEAEAASGDLDVALASHAAPAATATRGGADDDTILFAIEQPPNNLNWKVSGESFGQYTMQQVWPGVYVTQPDGSFVLNEDLVTSAEVTSEDPQVVEFVINADAVWSDGEAIDADDFIFNWVAQRGTEESDEVDDETGDPLPLYEVQETTGYDQIESIDASEDAKSFSATFSAPFADWKVIWEEVFPEHYFTAIGDGDPAAGWNEGLVTETLPDLAGFVSGGPYTLTDFTPDESMTLEANDAYWGDPPATGKIVMPFITDATQQPPALENGEADVIFPQAQIDLLQAVEAIDGVNVEVGFGSFWEFLMFNHENTHLGILEVRQAVGKAVNRAQIAERLPGQFDPNVEVLGNRFYVPGETAYEDNGTEYNEVDVAAARALLEKAGYTIGSDGVYENADGEKLTVRLGWRDPNERRQDSLELIQADLAAICVEAELDPNEDFSELLAGDFDIFIVGQTGTAAKVDNHSLFETGAGFNAGKYSNTEVDRLMGEAVATIDPEARAALYDMADELMWDDMALLPLFQNPELLASVDSVSEVIYNGYKGPTWNTQRWGLS